MLKETIVSTSLQERTDSAEDLVSTRDGNPLNDDDTVNGEASKSLYFPVNDLHRLDEMLNRIRWVVPVLPKNELETLLDASIALSRQGLDIENEHCQRFFREGLMISFVKILTDEAVNTWKYDIYKHIYNNSLKAIELCTLKLLDDNFPLHELLAMLFNPHCKYHISNSMRPPELVLRVNENKSNLKTIQAKNNDKFSNSSKSSKMDSTKLKQLKKNENESYVEENMDKKLENSSLNEKFPCDNKLNLLLDDSSNRQRNLSTDDMNTEVGESPNRNLDDNDDDYDEISVDEEIEHEDECVDRNLIDENENRQTNEDDDEANSNDYEGEVSDSCDEENDVNPSEDNKEINVSKSEKKILIDEEPLKNDTTDENDFKNIKYGSMKLNTRTTFAQPFTKSPYHMKAPHGWLVDFINHFGQLDGFKLLLERFTNNTKLNIQVIAALLKPWGFCYELLTSYTVKTFFLPIIEIVPEFFERLSDEDIKKECKSESKNDSISSVIKWLKLLATRINNQEDLCKNLEILRLKTILRILKFASFNGKMNALNEVNKVIANVTYNVKMRTSSSISGSSSSSSTKNENMSIEEEWLTSERMAKWIQENDVLNIVLRDCMHQPQYVEKLEKILRFLIKEKALTLKDLDKIWESQVGKHEAIEKNVHDLLSKLAWDFTPEQLDHLFSCFQKSWSNASRKQREKLLDLIRSLSEDDKEGVMANKVLDLLWNLAHSEDAPTEIIDQAVAAHIKILDYSCSSDKESQKLKCLEKCIEQLKDNKWVIVSMRQIREILQQYPEMIPGSFQTNRLVNYSQHNNSSNQNLSNNSNLLLNNLNSTTLNPTTTAHYSPNSSETQLLTHNLTGNIGCFYRPDIISKLQKEYSLISMITANLANYYENIRYLLKEGNNEFIDPESILTDGRFNHITQIQERLNFMKYLLKEGQLWLCSSQAETIWKCLAQNSVFECDREICFKWFSKLMTEDPDLEPDMNKAFFVNYITKLDPKLLTDSGIRCFERFFKNVNLKYNRLIQKRHFFLTESLDLIGLDYLWKIVTFANEDIVEKAILLLKDIYIHLGPQLKLEQSAIHADLISSCMDKLRVSHDNLTILNKHCKATSVKNSNSELSVDNDEQEKNDEIRSEQEITQILRVMVVLREYLNEFDVNYLYERFYPPLFRSSKGRSVVIMVRFQIQNRQNEELEIFSHTNETIGSLRRQIYFKSKINPQANKIDIIINNECIECVDDNKILGDYNIKDKIFIIARVSQAISSLNNPVNVTTGTQSSNNASRLDSSADSSSDECGSGNEDTHNVINSPNIEYELMLPSVILSLNEKYVQFLIELADFGCKINNTHIKECSRNVLDLLPIAKHTAEKIKKFCKECISKNEKTILDNLFFSCTSTQCWYYLKVTHSLLMPAVVYYNPDETKEFQENFILGGGVVCFYNMLVKENFLTSADDNTKKAALLYVLKINKLLMTTVCYAIYSYVVNALTTKQFNQVNEALHNHALLLQNSTSAIPSSTSEITLKSLAQRLGSQFAASLLNTLPDLTHILKLERIAWSLASNGTLNLVSLAHEKIHEELLENKFNDTIMETSDDVNVYKESLECLSLSLCLVPNALETLNQEKHWRAFIVDLVLQCGNQNVRQTASEQFLLIALKCSQNINRPLQFCIQMLFTCLHILTKENAQQSQEYFYLLCRLLNCANVNNVQISNTETLLNNEILWLKKIKQIYLGANDATDESKHMNNINSDEIVDEMLLDGHLGITKELVLFQTSEKKHSIGSKLDGALLINDLVEYFIFPASFLFKKYRDALIDASQAHNSDSTMAQGALNQFEALLASKSLKSICNSSMTTISAFDLLVSLCTGNLENFYAMSELLLQLFYPSLLSNSNQTAVPLTSSILRQTYFESSISTTNPSNIQLNQLSNDCTISTNEWEYMPPVGQRPHNGFVGLKNAGATCYMNSVLQQLFMIKSIRSFILGVDTPILVPSKSMNNSLANESLKETSGFEDLDDTDSLIPSVINNTGNESDISKNYDRSPKAEQEGKENKAPTEEDLRREYNMNIFRHLQMIFGHLAESKMQYYVPKGFWRHFRFGGSERVNLREQHDAVEFFNSVVDCIDESMKSINRDQVCSKVLGGSFADQKICKGCPHRYSREESFTLLSVDVKHSQRLSESLEQYVKGDLLEGPNAYHCEKCNKKIDAVKRTCIKKLPKILAIQLKRFDYDWEREIAVKSNEYFEFPRELDMEPYTVKGIARLDQEALKQQEKHKNRQDLSSSKTELNSEQKLKNQSADVKSNDPSVVSSEEDEDDDNDSLVYSNNYKLVGIIVHSGQANGGHYYSFIQNKKHGEEEDTDPESTSFNSDENNWYKFDDGDVNDFKMDDEELRNQCFGGDYTGEVYDNIMKRMAYKKQKRWWNAYILFYERIKHQDLTTLNSNNQRHHSGDSNRSKQKLQSGSFVEEHYKQAKIPSFILKSVHKKNIKFLHHRHHFSIEYFQFIKKMAQANLFLCQNDTPMSDEVEDLCTASVQLALKFLFGVAFRVKKTLRGSVNDWYEILSSYAKFSIKARRWMINYFLVDNPNLIPQYYLDCPSNEIRSTMSKLLVTLVHLSIGDSTMEINTKDFINSQPSITVLCDNIAPLESPPRKNNFDIQLEGIKKYHINASESIIQTVMSILSKRDLINEQSSKYLVQYFQFFNMYASIGIQQCFHLIRSDVPLTLIHYALDELQLSNSNVNIFVPSSHISGSSSFSLNYGKMSNNTQNQNLGNNSSQYADLTKLFCVVSTLLRCFDLSAYCSSANQNATVLPNPYSHYNELKLIQHQQNISNSTIDSVLGLPNQIFKLPHKIEEYVFKQSKYIKKLLEETPNSDDTIKLTKFLCWENMDFSLVVLNELLWMITYHYSYELKPYLEMLYSLLNIQDSWQTNRISFAFNGIPNSKKDGLFEIIASSQNNYQKRGYQIIKMLVQLFSQCELAIDLINKNDELRKKWKNSRNWFFNEMEKCRMYHMPNYTYFQSPQSNETSQTYYLERTQSARITLEKALKFFPPSSNSTNNSLTVDNNDFQNEDENGTDNESLSDEENLEYRMKSIVHLKENENQTSKKK